MFTGNRGIIHDPDRKTLTGRRWGTQAWISCALEWKDRRREVWGRNYKRRDGSFAAGWSELFFLDEVTALAAGHRPCHTCRNKDAKVFHAAFCKANGDLNAGGKNKLLHGERWLSSTQEPQILDRKKVGALPDGAVIKVGNDFLAIKDGTLLPWSLKGYGKPGSIGQMADETVFLVTPASILGALREGYRPIWHASAS